MNGKHNFFMRRAIELAGQGMNLHAGGPFGAVIVKDGEIIAEGTPEQIVKVKKSLTGNHLKKELKTDIY